MTVRQVYTRLLVRLKKRKAPALYPEDFLIYFEDAIQDRLNLSYANYEKTQLLTDDLSNLTKHVVIDIDDDVPFPFNIHYIDGSDFVVFHNSYEILSLVTFFASASVSGLNGSSNYRNQSVNDISILRNSAFTTISTLAPSSQLDQLIFDSIDDGTIIKIENSTFTIRDYRFDGNTNKLPFGFNLFDNNQYLYINPYHPAYFVYNASTRMFDYIFGKGYTIIDEQRISIHSPNNYWHITGMKNVLEYKKRLDCEKVFNLKVGAKRLTDEVRASVDTRKNVYLEPSVKRRNNYYHELNNENSVYPDFELLYCNESEKDLVQLKQVEFLYLKEPIKYRFSDADLDGPDNTESLEFQDYICMEIIEQLELLILERNGDPRVKTQPIVNNTNDMTRAKK